MSQSQTYRITNIDDAARKLTQDLLDMTVISGGKKEARLRERAYDALKADIFTVENAETILTVIDDAMKSRTTPDGRTLPGTLTGAGFRILSKLFRQMEAIKEGDIGAGVDGVEAIGAGNGTAVTAG